MQKAIELAEKAKSSLEKFVGNAKLKSHLASMEMKDSWEKVEKQIDMIGEDIREFTAAIKQDKDEAKLQGHLALMNAKERWETLRGEIDKLVSSISDRTAEKIDHAQVKISLAKLETRELIDKSKVGSSFKSLGKDAKEEWYTFLSKVDERVVDLINRFPLK